MLNEKRIAWVRNFFKKEEGIKYIHFTHGEDADGVGCGVLSKLFLGGLYDVTVIPVYYSTFKREVEKVISEETLDPKKTRFIITDLAVNADIVNLLDDKGILFLWIDHHVVPGNMESVVSNCSNFFVRTDEYTEREFASYFDSEDAFNPEYYLNGTVKYSAFPLYYVVISMLDLPIRNTDLSEFENWVIEPLSNSDTYHFKYRISTAPELYWVNASEPANQTEFLGKLLSMGYITDLFPIIFKTQGVEAFTRFVDKIFERSVYRGNSITQEEMQEFPEVVMAKLAHRKRLEEYRFFKNTCRPVTFRAGNSEDIHMLFTPTPGADFSIFSHWILDEDPIANVTFGVFADSRTVTMRSTDDGPDVMQFCHKYFNGGGHVHAAGGKISPELLLEILRAYYRIKMHGNFPEYGSLRIEDFDGELFVTKTKVFR